MASRLASAVESLWVRVALVMVAPAIVGLFAAYLVFSHVSQGQERASNLSQNTAKAKAIAPVIERAPTPANLQAMQQLLGDDQLIVDVGGRRLFTGPPNPERPHQQVSVPITNGYVRVVGDVDSTTVLSIRLTGIAALLVLFVLASAGMGTGVLLRSVRDPVRRATGIADRLSAGDLTARIGPTGIAEFGRLASTFDTMAARLEDTDRRQREFLADLAHEIATPLNTLAGITGGVLDGTIRTPVARERARELLEVELDRVRSLLADIRRLGSIEAPSTVRAEPVDLEAVCRRARDRFGARADAAGLQLNVRARRVQVRSDQRLIETVLDNLLTNALRYTPGPGHVDLAVRKRGDEVVLAVSDTGPGIPTEHQTRIFERFYRTDTARDRDHGGTGLGLAIAQRSALALGGRIELDSTPGKGSEFRLVLPASPHTKRQIPATSDSPSVPNRS